LLIVLMLALASGLPGVGDETASASASAQTVAAAERRVIVFAGKTLVVPVSGPAGETTQSGWRPVRPPKVEWGTDRAEASLRYCAAPQTTASPTEWLPPASEWTSFPLSSAAGNDSSTGFWALVVEAPATARAKPLRIDGRTVPTVWLDDPPTSTDSARLPRLEAARESESALVALLQRFAQDPFRRWRAALALERFGPESRLPAPSDAAVAALAAQNETRWRAAFAALARDDADLSADVLARATAVIASPDGPLLPAWSLDESGLSMLRDDLLDPDLGGTKRIARARTWLETDPSAVAWVIDDAGDLPAAGPYALVGVANLARAHAVASLAVEGEAGKNPVRLPGQGAVAMRAFFDTPLNPGAIGSAVIARVGAWTRALPVGRTPLTPAPPGLVLGPLQAEWDLASWRAGVPSLIVGERAAVALLAYSPEGRSWTLYIESRFPPGNVPESEVVTVHIGPREGESRSIKVGPGAPESAQVAIDSDRWRTVVALPIEPNAQRVSIGLQRTEDSGRRSSWPRPMMPGQLRGPGRAEIDLTRWDGLSSHDP